MERPVHVLDVEGAEDYWKMMKVDNDQVFVTLLNLAHASTVLSHMTSMIGDARNIQADDNSFAVVFCFPLNLISHSRFLGFCHSAFGLSYYRILTWVGFEKYQMYKRQDKLLKVLAFSINANLLLCLLTLSFTKREFLEWPNLLWLMEAGVNKDSARAGFCGLFHHFSRHFFCKSKLFSMQQIGES